MAISGVIAAILLSAVVLTPAAASRHSSGPSGTVLMLLSGSPSDLHAYQAANSFSSFVKKLDSNIVPLTYYTNGSAKQQESDARAAIQSGMKVIVLDQVNPTIGAKIVLEAHANGVKVIAFDQMIKVQNLDYYAGYNPVAAGTIEGQFVQRHAPSGSELGFINGPRSDYMSIGLQNGYCGKVLCPLIKRGKFGQGGSCYAQSSSQAVDCAYKAASQNHNLGGLAVGPDGLGLGAMSGLKKAHAGHVVVAGGSATLPALRAVLHGTIGMSVYVPVLAETKAAASEVYAIIAGHPKASEFTHKLSNGFGPVWSAFSSPQAVTFQTLATTVVKDKYVTKKQLCKGLTAECRRAGI